MELKNVTFLVIGELYLAINTNLEKVFLLDNITFDVLKAIKDQYDMKNIEMQYGTEIVDKVIKNWQEFQRKGERKNRGQNDTEYIEFIADENRSKELVEGVFLGEYKSGKTFSELQQKYGEKFLNSLNMMKDIYGIGE